MSTQAIARWESRSGKHWVELYESCGYFHYRAHDAGGTLAAATPQDAFDQMERKVGMGLFQPDANTTPMKRVL